MSHAGLSHAGSIPVQDVRPDEGRARRPWNASTLLFSVICGFVVALSMCLPRLNDILRTGNFYDTDDAMRMVQVRALLAGQAWYDLTAWRLDPPSGSFMHWSRVVDVPIAMLVRFFELFMTGPKAELAARIAFPLSMQAGLLFAVAWLGRILAGPRAVAPSVALTVMSGFMLGQFTPGRVDHHAPQIVLLVLMTAAILAAFDPLRARMAALASFCIALSMSISVENFPYIAVLGAALPVGWVMFGAPLRGSLMAFGAGLAVALPLCFVAFNGPARWLTPACDAYSIVYLTAGVLGAATCCALACFDKVLTTIPRRGACAAVFAAAIGLTIWRLFPQCLGDPFIGIDPLVREIWLSNVTEVRSLPQLETIYPNVWAMMALPALLGVAGLVIAAFCEHGILRARFIAMAALACVGSLMAYFAIRAASSLAPIALMGGVWCATRLWEALQVRSRALATLAAFVAFLPFSPFFWAMAAPPDDNPIEDARSRKGEACRAASAYQPIAALPAGLIAAPIDFGAHLLAHTPHQVFAAPYHRNNHGNRLMIDTFLASPDDARSMLVDSGARYVALCPGQAQGEIIAARAPQGLAATLIKGDAPLWLRLLDVGETPFHIYELR